MNTTQTETYRCPSCGTETETAPSDCPECGTRVARVHRTRPWTEDSPEVQHVSVSTWQVAVGVFVGLVMFSVVSFLVYVLVFLLFLQS